MTREETIEIFKSLIEAKSQLNAYGINNEYGFRVGNNFFDALDTAIKALEQKYIIYEDGKIEPLEQEPCEDCVSRKAVLDYIYNDLGLGDEENGKDVERQMELESSYSYVESLPSVTPKQKTGHWILTSDDDYEYCTCSECGYQNGENWMIGSQIKFCQECGARMIEPQESEGEE